MEAAAKVRGVSQWQISWIMWVVFRHKELKSAVPLEMPAIRGMKTLKSFLFLYYLSRLKQTILLHWFKKIQQTKFPVVTNKQLLFSPSASLHDRPGMVIKPQVFFFLPPFLLSKKRKRTHGMFGTEEHPAIPVQLDLLCSSSSSHYSLLLLQGQSVHWYLRSINKK